MRTALWIVTVALWIPLPAVPQPTPASSWSPARAVLSGGLGTGTRDVATKVALSIGGPRREIIVRRSSIVDFEIFAPATELRDLAVLAAFRAAGARAWYRAAAGVGHVRRSTDGCWPACPSTSTVGLAWQGDVVFAPARMFGIGAQAFGNLNGIESFLGLTLSAHIGAMR